MIFQVPTNKLQMWKLEVILEQLTVFQDPQIYHLTREPNQSRWNELLARCLALVS